MANLDTPLGEHSIESRAEHHIERRPRRKAARRKVSEAKRPGLFAGIDGLGGILDVKRAQKVAAWYIDTSEKMAKRTLDLQARATEWAKETPLAPIFAAQHDFGKKLIERSADAARSLWRLS